MKQISIINQLDIDEGKVVTNKSDNYDAVFLKQGSLDGACGPYCVIMALLITGAVTLDEVHDLWNIKLSSRLGKLIKGMRKHDTLFSDGTTINELATLLDNSFGRILKTVTSEASGKKLIPFIIAQLKNNYPVIVGVKNGKFAHWLLAVGFEKEEDVSKLFFLDPSGIDTSNYWNAAIDLISKQSGRYPYAWINHNESSNEFIQFEEAIAIKSI
tara:strand:+ start:986 stop:1627 length:642 start_codon:yes stop_codon:yes gene_type:complete